MTHTLTSLARRIAGIGRLIANPYELFSRAFGIAIFAMLLGLGGVVVAGWAILSGLTLWAALTSQTIPTAALNGGIFALVFIGIGNLLYSFFEEFLSDAVTRTLADAIHSRGRR